MRCSLCLISLPSFTLHDVSRTKWLWITLWASTKAQSDFLFAFLFFYIRAPHCGSCHSMEKVEIFFDMLSFCLDVVRCSTCDITCIMYQRQLSYVNSFFGPNSLHFCLIHFHGWIWNNNLIPDEWAESTKKKKRAYGANYLWVFPLWMAG